MIRYLIIHKLKFFARELKNPWKVVLTLLLLFTAWIYGLLFGQLYNKFYTGEIDVISSEKLFNYTLIGIAGLTIARMFFPNYNPLKLLFPKYYPISKIKRYVVSLVNDFQKPYFFYILVFVLSATFHLENSTIQFLTTSFFILLSSHLVRRYLQYTIDFKSNKTAIVFHVLGLISIVSFFVSVFLLKLNLLFMLFILIAVLTFLGYIQESSITAISHREVKSKSDKLGITLKLLLNNKKARLPLIIGLIFKSFILLADFFLFRTKGKHLFEGQIVFWLFASPLIIFTYVFNNAWGFWKNIWLNIELRIGRYKPLVWVGLRLMIIPLILDIVITIPILLLSWADYRFILIFYFTTSIYLILLSFLWSLITPRKIASSFQMKGSTAPLSVIAAMGGVFILTTIKINNWFYIFIPLLIICGFIGLWLSLDMYKEKKYIIANKIMKE
jgi:hypothetical protein